MIELERTFLAGRLPEGLADCPSHEMVDIYFPATVEHPVLRLRKKGDRMVLTKKTTIEEGDRSRFLEQTIELSEGEYTALSRLWGKRLAKVRYDYDYNGRKAEVDVFQDALEGLVLVDFEFNSVEEKEAFEKPEFCLAEVTHEEFIAGGMLCGKSYADIKDDLEKFAYEALKLGEEEPELREEFVKEVLKGEKEWREKHDFKRKMTLKELKEL